MQSYTQPAALDRRVAQVALQQLQGELAGLTYLPAESSAFTHLIYYTTLSGAKAPCSEEVYSAIKTNHDADHATKRWLQGGLVSAVVSPVLIWASTLSHNNWVTAAGVATAVAANVISWISTGSNPDFKSDSANLRQDAAHRFSASLQSIAVALLNLLDSHPLLAREVALSLDIAKIEGRLREMEWLEGLSALQAAKNYVLGERIPEETPVAIRTLIEVRSLARQRVEEEGKEGVA